MSDLLDDILQVSSVFGESPTNIIRRFEQEIPKVCENRNMLTNYLQEAKISRSLSEKTIDFKVKQLGRELRE